VPRTDSLRLRQRPRRSFRTLRRLRLLDDGVARQPAVRGPVSAIFGRPRPHIQNIDGPPVPAHHSTALPYRTVARGSASNRGSGLLGDGDSLDFDQVADAARACTPTSVESGQSRDRRRLDRASPSKGLSSVVADHVGGQLDHVAGFARAPSSAASRFAYTCLAAPRHRRRRPACPRIDRDLPEMKTIRVRSPRRPAYRAGLKSPPGDSRCRPITPILDSPHLRLRKGSSRRVQSEELSCHGGSLIIDHRWLAREALSPTDSARELAARVPAPHETYLFEVKRLIVGQDRLLERLLIAPALGGHVLLEGVPGWPRPSRSRPSPR